MEVCVGLVEEVLAAFRDRGRAVGFVHELVGREDFVAGDGVADEREFHVERALTEVDRTRGEP